MTTANGATMELLDKSTNVRHKTSASLQRERRQASPQTSGGRPFKF